MKVNYKSLIFAIIILCVALSMNSCGTIQSGNTICTAITTAGENIDGRCIYTFWTYDSAKVDIIDECGKFKVGDTGAIELYNRATSPTVDFPEEFNQVSHDKTKPDTMICYQENGVYHLGFKH